MNDKYFIGVLGFVCLVYIFGTFTFIEELWLFVQLCLVSILALLTALSVNIIFQYRRRSRKFTISYVFLTISLGCYTMGEILWGYFDSVGLDTYPSLAEIFYTGYFLGAILFCIKICWNHRDIIPTWIKLVGIVGSVLCMALYLSLSIGYVDYETFVISSFFMILSSILVGVSMITALFTYKSTRLKKIWIMFGVVFFTNSVADIFYYSGENMGRFLYTDWVNIIWFSTSLLMAYALWFEKAHCIKQ